MLFTIYKENLIRLLKLALFVAIEKKAINSVVSSHVLLEVENNRIKLVATDLEVELIVEEQIDLIEVPGKLVVPFRKITEICRAITENIPLKIFANIGGQDRQLNIDSTQGFFKLNYLPVEVFPVITNKEFNQGFYVKAKFFQEIISKVSFAMGNEDSRYFLNGVLLQFSGEQIVSVAADGHRLMVWENNLGVQDLIKDLSRDLSMLIPRKSVFDMLKILSENSNQEFILIKLGDNHIRIEFASIAYTSKLLNASFPPYKKLIPINPSNMATVSREQLKNACLRAAALLGDRSQAIKLRFSKESIIITSNNEQGDLFQDSIVADLDGIELEICFNIKYLLDYLSNSVASNIIFKFNSATTAVLLQDPDLQSYYVLMPIQL